jgi:nicotinamidase-related amidase
VPLTKIDDVAALIVIDLQKGIVGMPLAHPAGDVVARSAQLARAFRHHGLPVVLVNVAGRPAGRTEATFNFAPPPDWTELVTELERQPNDYTVTKRQVGAFHNTALENILVERRVTQVVLTGIATGSGVEATARQAFDQGYNVALVVDAMTDRDEQTHRHSVSNVFPKIGETDRTANVLALLEMRHTTGRV